MRRLLVGFVALLAACSDAGAPAPVPAPASPCPLEGSSEHSLYLTAMKGDYVVDELFPLQLVEDALWIGCGARRALGGTRREPHR